MDVRLAFERPLERIELIVTGRRAHAVAVPLKLFALRQGQSSGRVNACGIIVFGMNEG